MTGVRGATVRVRVVEVKQLACAPVPTLLLDMGVVFAMEVTPNSTHAACRLAQVHSNQIV